VAATEKSMDDEAQVVIDRAFIRASATNAALRFFRPITVVFEKVGPNFYLAQGKPPRDNLH
jgi:hypothetical protein